MNTTMYGNTSLHLTTTSADALEQTSKLSGLSTSKTESQSSLNDFQPYYNFHFGSLNCEAFGSACIAHNVRAFPTFILYKDGAAVKTFAGEKNMQALSNFIEDTLESARPGSRPKDGVKLPDTGAHGIKSDAKPDVPAAKDKDPARAAEAGKEHNEKAALETADGTTSGPPRQTNRPLKAKKPWKPAKSTETPNELGLSVPLSAESFQKMVTTTQDPWFIKFYAPWCHHCQAMAPNWAELGRDMKGKLNIGEVNCDMETRLCRDVRLKGYPTILFFKGGERVEYDGLRGIGDLIHFATKAVDIGDGVRDVDIVAFEEMERTEEVIFVYFYDHATTSEDFAAIERVLLSLIGHAKLVKTNDPRMSDRFKISTWPRLMVSRDGRASYYKALAPQDIRDYRKVLGWMKSVWLPIVPELSASNSREIMDGKLVVLGILSRERPEEFVIAKREIKNAAVEWMDRQTQAFQRERQERRDAKQLRIEEAEDRSDQRALRAAKSIRVKMDEFDRKQVGFAWVDGVFWERWIRTTYGIEVKDGEKVIINDEDVSACTTLYEASPPVLIHPRRTADTGTSRRPATPSPHRAPPSSRRSRRSSPALPNSSPNPPPPPSRRSSSRSAAPSTPIPGSRSARSSASSAVWRCGAARGSGGYEAATASAAPTAASSPSTGRTERASWASPSAEARATERSTENENADGIHGVMLLVPSCPVLSCPVSPTTRAWVLLLHPMYPHKTSFLVRRGNRCHWVSFSCRFICVSVRVCVRILSCEERAQVIGILLLLLLSSLLFPSLLCVSRSRGQIAVVIEAPGHACGCGCVLPSNVLSRVRIRV